MSTKVCSRCKEEKSLECFTKDPSRRLGVVPACKNCNSARSREYYAKNKEKHIASCNAWRLNNQEKQRANSKEWYQKNKEHAKQRDVKYKKQRKKIDPVFKLKQQIRVNINSAIRRIGLNKSASTESILGCSVSFLVSYLEDTARQRYGSHDKDKTYHIDHIIPLASAQTEEDVIRLNHYTNLQLLTPEDNMRKSDKILT